MSEPLCTIVVVTRERYSRAAFSYESLRAHAPEGWPIIYVDACSPQPWSARLDALAAEGQFKLIRAGFQISQQESYNLAIPQVRTKYVVFVDNDVTFTPGWAEHLLACAEETGAAAVMPLMEDKEAGGDWQVHMCGGDCYVEERDGQLWFREDHPFHGQNKSDFQRGPTMLIEYHAFLVRMEALRAVGPFDEGYWPALDHTDFSLMIGAAGGELWLEPASLIRYELPPPVLFADLPIFLSRWSDWRVRENQRHFMAKWKVNIPPSHALWYRAFRRYDLHPLRDGVARRFGKIAGKIAYRLAWPLEAMTTWIVAAWCDVPDRRRRLEALGSWRAPELDLARIEAHARKLFGAARMRAVPPA